MAEINLGDVVARLRVDSTAFNQAIADATQRLNALQQALNQTRQVSTATQQSSQQLAQGFQALSQATTQQAQATTQQAQAYTQARGAATQYQQALQQVTQATQQAGQAAQTSGGLLRQAFAVAGGIGIATSIGALVGQMKDLAVSTVEAGTRMEQLRASLGAIAGSRGAGADQFQAILATANQLGVAFEPLARGWRTLTAASTAANIPLEVQRKLFTAVATEAKRVGASNEEVQRSLLALGQIASKGKVSMEEFRQQLAEAIPTAGGAAAKGFGITQEALQKLIESGVGAETFFKAITRGFEDMQQSGVQTGDTTASAFNRLGNAILSLKDAIAQSGLLQFLKEAAEGTTKLLNTIGDYYKARKLLQDTEREAATREAGFRPGQVTPQEAQRLRDLEKQIREAQSGQITGQPGSAVEGMQVPLSEARRGDVLQKLLEEQAALQEQLRSRIALNEEQAKGTAEARRQKALQDQQVEAEKTLQKVREEGQNKLKAFEEDAARRPEIMGRRGGTAEELETYRRNRQKVIEENTEALSKAIAALPPGVTVPPAILTGLQSQSKEYGTIKKAIEDADEAEKKRAKTERETLAQTERAVGQRIQLEHLLTEAKAFGAREDQNAAGQARARVEAQGEALRTRLEQGLEATRRNPQIGGDYAQRLRDRLAALPGQVEAQAAEAYNTALQKQLSTLDELARKYGFATQEANDLAKAQDEVMKLLGTPVEEAAFKRLATVEAVAKIEAKIVDLRREAELSEPAGREARRQADATARFEGTLADQLERLRTPRDERLEQRLRAQARREGVTLGPDEEAQLRAISNQERFNDVMDTARRLGDSFANTLTTGLLSIVDGTQSVSEGFAAMAQSILKSIAEITLNEGFRTLIRLGLGIAGAAITGGVTGGSVNALTGVAEGTQYIQAPAAAAGGGGGGGDFAAIGGGLFGGSGLANFQHGGVVHRPTLAMIGENPATSPEYVLNRPQMESLMRAAPSAGGQAAGGNGVTIINYTSGNKAQAEQEQAKQAGLGRSVVMNYIMDDLSQGSGSRIGQLLRAGQR